MTDPVQLHGVTGPPGSWLAAVLGDGLEVVAPLRGETGALREVVYAVSGPDPVLVAAGEGLSASAAQAEAVAARLRAAGAEMIWGDPIVVPDVATLLRHCRERGRSSVDLLRQDASLLSALQIGTWFDAGWRLRWLRRVLGGRSARALAPLARSSSRRLAALADLSFWSGVAERADRSEWRRLTANSYVALVYHRFAGELKPGQERIDIAPRRFARQLRALRMAGFAPLTAEEMVSFHAGQPLTGRRVAITVDDATSDCLESLLRHVGWSPQLFAPTGELGGTAHWIDGEPVASWDQVIELAEAGVGVGSHTRHHRRLTLLDRLGREQELAGSLSDLRRRLAAPLEIIAYPNGDHDADVCRQAREAGFAAGFTTQKGRNGAGTDPHCLKRVSVHGHDGVLAVLWKALTGEGLPPPWLRLRRMFGAG